MGMRSTTKSGLDRLPWWLLAFIGLAVLFLWLLTEDGDYAQILNTLKKGVGITLFLTFVAFTLASLLGLVVALGRGAKSRLIREIATFYTEIVRGVPVLVLLFYIAFVGAPQLVVLYNWTLGPLIDADLIEKLRVRDLSMMWRAILALTIGYSAFIAEVFRAGIESVDEGQVEAARSLGLTRWQTFRLVVWPQALKNILPPLGNDFVAMIKDSALVSVLGVQDITQLGKIYSASTFQFFETYNVVAFLYLIMTVSLSLLVRALEKRLKRGQEHKT
ncbi:amino acid ABC transporter permease [Pseudovibrio sp. Tun.PSC04-5.I4]|uniref:amino acid ABC transporter permease n=1 Tax=Pseudovibrio sp. Tun.PSC04-5.I4 TaxID=1798213 RepID=UPI00087FEF83|nr:amino acid ABC transporter permease [Pseudovibrio sp. Tun.PSC04-5.I4]SDQ77799.1 amino acid ABC transporter membrane protein, PAAT family [Pseudovibrio sp. Tun.PSC04-5.I4]